MAFPRPGCRLLGPFLKDPHQEALVAQGWSILFCLFGRAEMQFNKYSEVLRLSLSDGNILSRRESSSRNSIYRFPTVNNSKGKSKRKSRGLVGSLFKSAEQSTVDLNMPEAGLGTKRGEELPPGSLHSSRERSAG